MDNFDITQVIKSVQEFITTLQRVFASRGWADYSRNVQNLGHVLMGETHVLEKMCDPLLEKILEDTNVDMSVRLAALCCVGEMFEGYVQHKGLPDEVVHLDEVIPEKFSDFIVCNYNEQLRLMQKVSYIAHNTPTQTAAHKM